MSYANAVTVRLCALDHTGFKVQYDLIKSLGNIPAKCAKALCLFCQDIKMKSVSFSASKAYADTYFELFLLAN